MMQQKDQLKSTATEKGSVQNLARNAKTSDPSSNVNTQGNKKRRRLTFVGAILMMFVLILVLVLGLTQWYIPKLLLQLQNETAVQQNISNLEQQISRLQDQISDFDALKKLQQDVPLLQKQLQEQWLQKQGVEPSEQHLKRYQLTQHLALIEQNIRYHAGLEYGLQELNLIAREQKAYLATIALTDALQQDIKQLEEAHHQQQALSHAFQQSEQAIQSLPTKALQEIPQAEEKQADYDAAQQGHQPAGYQQEIYQQEQDDALAPGHGKLHRSLWQRTKQQIADLWQFWSGLIVVERVTEPVSASSFPYSDQQEDPWLQQQLSDLNQLAYAQAMSGNIHGFDRTMRTLQQRAAHYDHAEILQPLLENLKTFESYKIWQQNKLPLTLQSLDQLRMQQPVTIDAVDDTDEDKITDKTDKITEPATQNNTE